MSYLQKLGLGPTAYDREPEVAVRGYDDHCRSGWPAVVRELNAAVARLGKPAPVVAIDCYAGILDEEVVPGLREGLRPQRLVETEKSVFKSPEEIDELVAPWLGGDDPVFGCLTRLRLEDFLHPESRERTRALAAEGPGLTLVYGPGALLCCEPDLVVYADLARWEAQQRQRAGKISNLGVENRALPPSLQYKRGYFVDWRVCDKHKRATLDRWDYLLDTCAEGDPRLVTGDALRGALRQTTRRPFRVAPFFDPGIWGGQWMRELCDLPDGPPNYAWCFDCVPEENSLLLRFGDRRVEIPAINLVLRHPEELLGEPVYGRYGAEFPIRFDLLDTMGGQNLSFQVHPLIDYAREHFGLHYTQDESYYILDAEEDARVYLGLKDGIDPTAMLKDLRASAEDPDRPFPDDKHVARFPAKRHDHFLIPAGTCHCSGAGSMVLEISHTPYIFTFKLWDWARLDLNGLPRPINLERGAANIQWNRTESWVRKRLINRVEPVAEGDGWREERTGLYRSEAFETRRHWFTGTTRHDTRGESVHVLNLVQGPEAVIESPADAFEPFPLHFAETAIVPAAVGPYTVRPRGHGDGRECATVKAFVRVNA